ncbi:MAG: sulfatase-like hydrolase/transferase, partial [bacterium]
VLDSLRQDHVGAYHGGRAPFPDIPAAQTPNLDAFSRRAVVFTNAYPEALPTIPARYTLMTGQRTLPFRPWGPLHPGEITIPQILRNEDYVCGLISDCYHYCAPGMNYHRGFHACRWIRGQEYDPWESAPTRRSVDGYVNARYTEEWRRRVAQFLANTDSFASDADWFSAQVMEEATTWLRKNRVHDRIFLWVDCFDPHEPWDPPPRFDTYTSAGYRGPRLILPMGGLSERWATPEEVRHLRGLYAGEVAFVDSCVGKFFAALEELGYLEDSIVVVLADHGHPLGDHGKFLKGADRLYSELLRIPFMVRLPRDEDRGRHTDALVQFQDVLPTLLDLLGLQANLSSMHGRSFRHVVEGDTQDHRDAIITGYHEGADRCVRTKRWSYIERPAGQRDELYDLSVDAREQHNLIQSHAEEAERLARMFGRYYRVRRRLGGGIQGKYEMASSGLEEPVFRNE